MLNHQVYLQLKRKGKYSAWKALIRLRGALLANVSKDVCQPYRILLAYCDPYSSFGKHKAYICGQPMHGYNAAFILGHHLSSPSAAYSTCLRSMALHPRLVVNLYRMRLLKTLCQGRWILYFRNLMFGFFRHEGLGLNPGYEQPTQGCCHYV